MKIKMLTFSVLIGVIVLLCTACDTYDVEKDKDPFNYELNSVSEVMGRQGIASEGEYYWVSDSAALYKYDKKWNLIAENKDPLKEYEIPVNHLGDIDVYQNEIYVGAENFVDGVGKDIQIGIYDGDTLELKRAFSFRTDSGQKECSGICVDPDTKTVVMTSWVGEESGRYLYRYDLENGNYLGKVHLQSVPQWIQGIAYYDGYYYMTADDGTADENESDHIYRTEIKEGQSWCTTTLEYTLKDVAFQGEIEGLSFDKSNKHLMVLYNRGSRIVLGMVKGFYPGYNREISEIYCYSIDK